MKGGWGQEDLITTWTTTLQQHLWQEDGWFPTGSFHLSLVGPGQFAKPEYVNRVRSELRSGWNCLLLFASALGMLFLLWSLPSASSNTPSVLPSLQNIISRRVQLSAQLTFLSSFSSCLYSLPIHTLGPDRELLAKATLHLTSLGVTQFKLPNAFFTCKIPRDTPFPPAEIPTI